MAGTLSGDLDGEVMPALLWPVLVLPILCWLWLSPTGSRRWFAVEMSLGFVLWLGYTLLPLPGPARIGSGSVPVRDRYAVTVQAGVRWRRSSQGSSTRARAP